MEGDSAMKKFGCLFALLLILALAGCASESTGTSRRDVYPSPNWGTDAACSPGCPPGMSGAW